MNIHEAKAILVPLCPTKAAGRPLSPGFCDEDLIAIAQEMKVLRWQVRRLEWREAITS